MNPIVRKATRKKAKLRLGVSAPSGAGKTFGSLVLAYGIIRAAYPNISDAEVWDKIGLADTEEGSGELFVGKSKFWPNGDRVTIGEFQYVRISAPFSAIKYLEAQRALEATGCEVIIHDSLTHAWAGTGGLLEKQGRIADADPKKNSYTAWRTVTPDHTALVDALLQSPAHIIGTMRSKVEYSMQNGPNGKQQVVKLGMAPIQREGMEYEFTVFFDINTNSIASATKDRTDLYSTINAAGFLEKREFMITPGTGKELYEWLNTGAEPIEKLAERLAADVAVSTDLQDTYQAHAVTFKRMAEEKPDWVPMMESLFNNRQEELKK